MSQEKLSLKGSLFPITVMDLVDNDFSTLRSKLAAAVRSNPAFFADAPLIVDCGQIADEALDFNRLRAIVSEAGMFLIGVSGTDETQTQQAHARGLPRFKQIGSKRNVPDSKIDTPAVEAAAELSAKPVSIAETDQHIIHDLPSEAQRADMATDKAPAQITAQSPSDPPAPAQTDYHRPMIVHGIVRSGQRLYAEARDMIVFGNVSPGAEIIADGNIHIYGKLRGRALAGAQGSTDAFICATQIQAELISIAGYYKVLEDDQAYASMGAIMVTLNEASLKFTTLDQS